MATGVTRDYVWLFYLQDSKPKSLKTRLDFGRYRVSINAATYGGLYDSAREERGRDSGPARGFRCNSVRRHPHDDKDQASSLVFRIVVRGSPFLLKIIMRTDDPARHYTCMKAAAEAGLAPRVWYTSIEDRISITDFVEAVPFPVTDALVRMPATLRTLHALPPFPGVPNHINTSCMFLINKGPALDGFIRRFQAANILPKGESEELFARYAQMAAVYPRHDADMVSSHNDLFKPDNILFDGHRVWLVDWEAAFLNDRYADLAVVANLVVTNDAEEKGLSSGVFRTTAGSVPASPILPHAAGRPHLLRHGFPLAGFVGQAGRPE